MIERSATYPMIVLQTSGATEWEISLHGDGTAHYRGRKNTPRYGLWQQQVAAEAVRALVEDMLAAGFFEQPDVLDRGLTRHPTWQRLTLGVEGKEHSVSFDGNRFAEALHALAARVEMLAYRDFWKRTPSSEPGASAGLPLGQALYRGLPALQERCNRRVGGGFPRTHIHLRVPPTGDPEIQLTPASDALRSCVVEWLAELAIQPLPEEPSFEAHLTLAAYPAP